jgi:hypothetical protein
MAKAVPPGSTEERHERLRDAPRFQRDHFAQTPVIVACYDFGPYLRRVRAQARHLATAFAQLGPRRPRSSTGTVGRPTGGRSMVDATPDRVAGLRSWR